MDARKLPLRQKREVYISQKTKTLTNKQTGDEASLSPDGYVTITGRIKDLIIRGGENIHPLEIENCLLSNPAVADVSVVGVPDERYGEVVAAFVIPREQQQQQSQTKDTPAADEDGIKGWVREKLSNHLGKLILVHYLSTGGETYGGSSEICLLPLSL